MNELKTKEIEKTNLNIMAREEVKTSENQINNYSQEINYINESNQETILPENIIPVEEDPIPDNEVKETVEVKFENIINEIEEVISKMIEANMYYTIIDNNYVQIIYEQNTLYIDVIGETEIILIQYYNNTKEVIYQKMSNGEEINNTIINEENITEDTLNISSVS